MDQRDRMVGRTAVAAHESVSRSSACPRRFPLRAATLHGLGVPVRGEWDKSRDLFHCVCQSSISITRLMHGLSDDILSFHPAHLPIQKSPTAGTGQHDSIGSSVDQPLANPHDSSGGGHGGNWPSAKHRAAADLSVEHRSTGELDPQPLICTCRAKPAFEIPVQHEITTLRRRVGRIWRGENVTWQGDQTQPGKERRYK
jgi:hypothetical protein